MRRSALPGLRATLLAVLGLVATPVSASPEIDYMLQCQGCHLPDGRGAPGKVPSLEGMGRFLLVPGGREFLVRVPGASSSPLSDAALAAVLNWMLARFGPEQVVTAQPAYTAEEVAGVRRPPLSDVEALRARLVEEIRAAEAASP